MLAKDVAANTGGDAAGAPFSLAGEVALITGGGAGLGFGIASAFVRAGAAVVLTGRREAVLAAAVEQLGERASYKVHDVTVPDRAGELLAGVAQQAGLVSILVNNAGVHLKKPFLETSEKEFRAVLDTHLMGAFAVTQAAAPSMIERKHGSILFIASMTSFIGMPGVIAYSAAKSAYLGLVRTLASELSAQGVRVNAIAPGWIESAMLHKALDGDPARKARILSRTPMGRFGAADDIGNAAVYLCSPAAKFVTGVVLPVDGGASIGF